MKMQATSFYETSKSVYHKTFFISQSTRNSIENLFPHFQSASSPNPRTDFVCFSVVTDGLADKRILILWIEISEKILEILVPTFPVLCSWFPSPLSHRTVLLLTPILCISPFYHLVLISSFLFFLSIGALFL